MTSNPRKPKPVWALVESSRKLAHIYRLELEAGKFELRHQHLGVAGDEFCVVQNAYSSVWFRNEEPAWIQCAIDNGFGGSEQPVLNDALAVLIEYERSQA